MDIGHVISLTGTRERFSVLAKGTSKNMVGRLEQRAKAFKLWKTHCCGINHTRMTLNLKVFIWLFEGGKGMKTQ